MLARYKAGIASFACNIFKFLNDKYIFAVLWVSLQANFDTLHIANRSIVSVSLLDMRVPGNSLLH